MWDNHQMLGFLANSLFALAALIAGYFISKWAINLPVFPLKVVSVSSTGTRNSDLAGAKHVTREQIEDAVRSQVRGNFFTVDLAAVRNAFRKLPWVRTANVRRVWPQGLDVTLEEHVALARWGTAALVDTHGEIFNAASDEQLPLFDGPEESSSDMVGQYHVFSKLLRPLEQYVDYMKLSPRRAWQIRLGNGTVLELGREQMGARLGRYVLAHAHGMVQLNPRLSYVDLRYSNGFAAR
ncbi:cell division protein FtsQ/DivIB [Nitrosovibrio tenuis]|uniref:Cell division protein FtsQ n=1 Tax=Nitrosovibrio tenuis TaxID=1233 RepID=A0A1H7G4R2_9PROT|nr:cell division protein FtsQ/DivIB [Nitrosovibrio tenuis]SEK31782.1 cell division protein FtsQ [Nitrosovibrio tenuis]